MGHQHFLYARKVCKGQDSEGSSQKWALKGKIHQTGNAVSARRNSITPIRIKARNRKTEILWIFSESIRQMSYRQFIKSKADGIKPHST